MVSQVSRMTGMEVSAVADLDLSRAISAYNIAGYPEDRVARVATTEQANEALRPVSLWSLTGPKSFLPWASGPLTRCSVRSTCAAWRCR